MNAEQREYLLRVLYQVFRDGYRPSRGDENYDRYLPDSNLTVSSIVNCFGHTFNLRNQQYTDYHVESPYRRGFTQYFTQFMGNSNNYTAAIAMLDFMRETGLQVTPCLPEEPIKDFASWKIAMYFSLNDFHFLLQETPTQWSGKIGFSTDVDRLTTVEPPHKYRFCKCPFPEYHLYGTYRVTNPHADENNRYVNHDHLTALTR